MNTGLPFLTSKSYFRLLQGTTFKVNIITSSYSSNNVSATASNVSSQLSQLKGRDLYTAENYSSDDFHSLLWIAHDLKHSKTDFSNLCKSKSFFLVNKNPITKISCNIAASRLGATLTCVHENDFSPILTYGRSLSPVADIIFVETSVKDEELSKLADESSVPLINVQSLDFAPLYVLAELLTLYEYYGFLKRVTIGYIGPGDNPILNSYATMLPKLGMHLRCFASSSETNIEAWITGAKLAAKFNTELQQKDNWKDSIYRAHTISIWPSENNDIHLIPKNLEEMELKWSVFPHNNDTASCISSEILNSKECLERKSLTNLSWIFQQ